MGLINRTIRHCFLFLLLSVELPRLLLSLGVFLAGSGSTYADDSDQPIRRFPGDDEFSPSIAQSLFNLSLGTILLVKVKRLPSWRTVKWIGSAFAERVDDYACLLTMQLILAVLVASWMLWDDLMWSLPSEGKMVAMPDFLQPIYLTLLGVESLLLFFLREPPESSSLMRLSLCCAATFLLSLWNVWTSALSSLHAISLWLFNGLHPDDERNLILDSVPFFCFQILWSLSLFSILFIHLLYTQES